MENKNIMHYTAINDFYFYLYILLIKNIDSHVLS